MPAPHSEPGSSPRQHVENTLQRRRVDVAIDANPAPALQLDLDQPRFCAAGDVGVIDRRGFVHNGRLVLRLR
jgi:hypothetical protein